MTILAVDHCVGRLANMDAFLREIFPHATVLCFAKPLDAVQYSFKNPVEHVFCDTFSGAETDGLQLAEGVRFRNRRAKIHLMAEGEAAALPKAGRKAGVAGRLAHPGSAEELRAYLSRLE